MLQLVYILSLLEIKKLITVHHSSTGSPWDHVIFLDTFRSVLLKIKKQLKLKSGYYKTLIRKGLLTLFSILLTPTLPHKLNW